MFDLGSAASDFENEMLGCGVDYGCLEGIGETQGFQSLVAIAGDLDQCQFPLEAAFPDWRAVRGR